MAVEIHSISSLVSPAEIEAAVRSLGSVIADKKATYVATPITSGHRFIEWFATYGRHHNSTGDDYQQDLLHRVIEPNIAAARRKIGKLRETNPVLIDPTQLDLPGWSQNDYRLFWGRVIEAYVCRAVFLDGWALSSGCAYEFFVTSKLGIAQYKEDGSSLQYEEGCQELLKSIQVMDSYSIKADFHRDILGSLISQP